MKIEVDRQKHGFLLKEEGKISYYADLGDHAPCGDYGLTLRCYEDGKSVFDIHQKSWATSLLLRTGVYWREDNSNIKTLLDNNRELVEDCIDPRIIMMHILAGKLMIMARWGEYDEEKAEKEINSVLPNPSFQEARDWLKNNGFGGKNRRKSRGSRNAPGWSIAYDDYDLIDLPPDTEKLYSKYKKLWKEAESKENEGE